MSALMRMPSYDTADDSWSNRRMFPRKEVHETVEGRRLDHTIEARQQPRLNLMLRDLSLGGLSAISDKPISKGEHLTIVFPPRPGQRGWDAFGRVLRCEASSLGYRLAMEFDPLPAA
jgi:hypothetical protein